MKGDLQARLNNLRRSGDLKTGRRLSEAQPAESDNLFPGEGREIATAFGRCYLREIQLPLEHRHGGSSLSGLLSCCGSNLVLPARDRRMEYFDPCRAVFLDIETTGLAGGTGTWAFLIGVGRVEQEHFVLRQYFLRRPAEEQALLSHFAAEIEAYPALITFNGKMFDLPLIQTRQLLSGFKQTEPQLHIDLLHYARVLWKKRLASRSLRSLEESLLGLRRCGDIPGEEIPAVYFDYLRRGKTERLKTVFNHNVLDILSMVTLLERISLLGGGKLVEHPAEALALGQLCIAAGRTEEGISYLHQAASGNVKLLAGEAAMELARFYKRQGNWPEALAIWHQAVEDNRASPADYVELAKYYEHQAKAFRLALELTEEAIRLAEAGPSSPGRTEHGPDALRHRQARLVKRLAVCREL